MTVNEAQAEAVLDRLTGIWPQPAWPSSLFSEWMLYLHRPQMDAVLAEAAVESVKRHCRRRPSFAEFDEAMRDARRTVEPPPERRALEHATVAPASRATVDEALKIGRDALAKHALAQPPRVPIYRPPPGTRMASQPRHVSAGLDEALADLAAGSAGVPSPAPGPVETPDREGTDPPPGSGDVDDDQEPF